MIARAPCPNDTEELGRASLTRSPFHESRTTRTLSRSIHDDDRDRDISLSVASTLRIRRLGLAKLADIVLVCLYGSNCINPGEDPVSSHSLWDKAFDTFWELPSAVRTSLLSLDIPKDSVGPEDKDIEDSTKWLLSRLGVELHGTERCSSYSIAPARTQLPFLTLRDLRHSVSSRFEGARHPPSTTPVLEAVFRQLVAEFYRRISIYAHQYLEPDVNSALVPAKVFHVRFKKDGKIFVTAGDDGLLKVWDSQTLRLAYTLRRHFSDICEMDLCPDGRTIVSCCSSNQIRVWTIFADGWQPEATATLPAMPTFIRFLPACEHSDYCDVEEATYGYDVEPSPHKNTSSESCGAGLPHEMEDRSPLSEPGEPKLELSKEPTSSSVRGSVPLLFLNTADDGIVRIYDAANCPKLPALTSLFSYDVPVTSQELPPDSVFSIRPVYSFSLHGYRPKSIDVFSSTVPSPEQGYFVFVALGLEANDGIPPGVRSLEVPASPFSCPAQRSGARLVVCRLWIRLGSGAADNVVIKHQIASLPIDSVDVPDVAFASDSPDLLASTDDNRVLICRAEKPWSPNWRFKPSVSLRLLVAEKMLQHEYKIYQHPLVTNKFSSTPLGKKSKSPQPKTAKSDAESPDMFLTHVTSIVWCNEDSLVVTGNSLSRKAGKNSDHERAITKETEIAIFDTQTGVRLLSITDRRKFKSNISFLRAHPIVSSIVIVGTFRGQILLLDVQRTHIHEFLKSLKIDPEISPSALHCSHPVSAKLVSAAANVKPSKRLQTNIVTLACGSVMNLHHRSIEELHVPKPSETTSLNKRLDIVLNFMSFPKTCFLDGRWCPSGRFFVATQKDGCLSIFSSINCKTIAEVQRLSDPFLWTPVEQFLDNDFRVFHSDMYNRVLCPFTGIPPHELPLGPQVDGNRAICPVQLPTPNVCLDKSPAVSQTATPTLPRDKKTAEIVQRFNNSKLDEYGNVSSAVDYVPPPTRRIAQDSPSNVLVRTIEPPSQQRSISGIGRYGTILSAAFGDDETDSSETSSIGSSLACHIMIDEPEDEVAITVSSSLTSSDSISSGDEETVFRSSTTRIIPRRRGRQRLTSADDSVERVPEGTETAAEEEEPGADGATEFALRFWSLHDDPVNTLRNLVTNKQSAGGDVNEAECTGTLPRSRLQLLQITNDILLAALVELLACAARDFRHDQRNFRHEQRNFRQAATVRRRRPSTDSQLAESGDDSSRSSSSSSSSTSSRSSSLSKSSATRQRKRAMAQSTTSRPGKRPRLTARRGAGPPQKDDDGRFSSDQRKSVQMAASDSDSNDSGSASSSSEVKRAKRRKSNDFVGKPLDLSAPATSLGVPIASFVEEQLREPDVFGEAPEIVLFSRLGCQPSDGSVLDKLYLSQLRAIYCCISLETFEIPTEPHVTGTGKRSRRQQQQHSRQRNSASSRVSTISKHTRPLQYFPFNRAKDILDSIKHKLPPRCNDGPEIKCAICHQAGKCLLQNDPSPIILSFLPLSSEHTSGDAVVMKHHQRHKSIVDLVRHALGNEDDELEGIHKLKTTPAVVQHFLASFSSLREVDNAEEASAPTDNYIPSLFTKRLVGPFVVDHQQPSSSSRQTRRAATMDHSISQRSEEWIHASCLCASFCSLDDETRELLVAEPKVFSSYLQPAVGSTPGSACSHCGISGAAILCSHCSSAFHWQCAQSVWHEADRSSNARLPRRQFPDKLKWGVFVCPKVACARSFRGLGGLMAQQFFSSPRGCLARNWCSSATRLAGDYVPQLGDAVRIFPSILMAIPAVYPRVPLFFEAPSLAMIPANAVVVNLRYAFPSAVNAQESVHVIALLSLLILPPHPAGGRVIELPHYPSHQQPFVLLSEVRHGFSQIGSLKPGDKGVLFIDFGFHSGTVSKVQPIIPLSQLTIKGSEEDIMTKATGRAELIINLVSRVARWPTSYDYWADEPPELTLAKKQQHNGKAITKLEMISSSWQGGVVLDRLLEGIDAIELVWHHAKDSPGRPLRRNSGVSISSRNSAVDEKEVCSYWEVFPTEKDGQESVGGRESIDKGRLEIWNHVIDNVMKKPVSKTRVVPETRQTELRNHQTLLSTDEKARGSKHVKRIYEQFIEAVPLPSSLSCEEQTSSWIVEYWSEIELPISLDLISRRLKNKYYRSEIAVVFDLVHLFNNCVRFNGADNNLTILARNLVQEVLEEVAASG